MIDLGGLIFRTIDDEGEIHVCQDARFRYLTFGNAVEQSCLDLANPVRLEHVYTQAMMLGLLFKPGARWLALLGMGGGSLARALRAASRGARIQAVDHRGAVIEVARTYFDLPGDRLFTVVCEEAEVFLRSRGGPYDLIFSDLYLAEGVYPGQAATDFLRLGIPLQRHARNLWRQNAEILGVGRFRNRRQR